MFSRSLEGFPPVPSIPMDIPTSSASSISSKKSKRSFRDDSVIQLLLSGSPRSQTVSFSSNTDYVLCTSANHYGSIYKVLEPNTSSPVLKIGGQPTAHQKITTVDWANSSNACLFGTIDGTVKITSLIKV